MRIPTVPRSKRWDKKEFKNTLVCTRVLMYSVLTVDPLSRCEDRYLVIFSWKLPRLQVQDSLPQIESPFLMLADQDLLAS